MTLAGLLPVRKVKAGIAMSCPVRECHVVFVRSESSHLNSSNKKQYENVPFTRVADLRRVGGMRYNFDTELPTLLDIEAVDGPLPVPVPTTAPR